MNISTASLLSILSLGSNSQTDKNQTVTKTPTQANLNNNSISVLLNELFSNISTGEKTKAEVLNTIKENKNSFSFKNLSLDLKIIIEHLQKHPTKNSAKHIEVLKNSVIDLKNISQIDIKNKVENSGVFLESKLLNFSKPIMEDIKQLKQNIQELITLKDIKVSKATNQTAQLDTAFTEIKNIKDIKIPQEIKPSLKEQIKKEVNEILKIIKDISKSTPKQFENKVEQAQKLIQNLDKTIQQNKIQNNIVINLKEALTQVKTQFLEKTTISLQKNINLDLLNIQNKLQNIQLPQSKELSVEFEHIKSSIKTMPPSKEHIIKLNHFEIKLPQNRSVLESLKPTITQSQPVEIKTLTNDLKATILNLQQDINLQNNNPDDAQYISKEIKATIDKVQSQIEFFQLTSLAQGMPQMPLSFLQDDIEDVDIKFNKTQEDGYSCQLNLNLKQYGELRVLLTTDKNKNLSVNMGVVNIELKTMMQKTLQDLRMKLSSTGLVLQNLNIFDIQLDNKNNNNLYTQSQNISFGVDIQA
jgi:hypothetical protein